MNAHIAGRNVVVTVSGEDSPETRQAARKAACGEAHTATIGKLLKVAEVKGGTAYTWGPVTPRGTRKVAAPASTGRPEADALAAQIADLQAQLATLTGAPVAPVTAKPVFAPIAKAAARKAAAACGTCMDLGHVRKTARDNGSVNYRTPAGRDASITLGNAKVCEAKGCKAARKAA